MASSAPLVHIILLNWNNWRDTLKCLQSLQALRYPNHQTVVVDNASSDDSVSQLRRAFPDLMIIPAGANLGFAGGCNIGIRRALQENADFVWLLNNDTTVDPAALETMVEEAARDCRIGGVGSVIYSMNTPDEIQAWGGGYVNGFLGRSRHCLSVEDEPRLQFITGASLLLRREALQQVGILDESYFMYWEDADWCFRLRRSGWKIAIAQQSRIWHKVSASFGARSPALDINFQRSALRFFRTHSKVPAVPILVGTATRLGKRLLQFDWPRARAVWSGSIQRTTSA